MAGRRSTTPRKRGYPKDTTDIVPDFSPARLKAARTRRYMSEQMLGDAIGAAPDAVRAWESGAAPVREYTLRPLCCAMGVAPECLLDPPIRQGEGA